MRLWGAIQHFAWGPDRAKPGATPEHATALHAVLMQQFIASHAKPPKELVLDVDAWPLPALAE